MGGAAKKKESCKSEGIYYAQDKGQGGRGRVLALMRGGRGPEGSPGGH